MRTQKTTRQPVRISISRCMWSACLAGSLLTWLCSPVGWTQSRAVGAISTSSTQRAIELVKSAQAAFEQGDYDRALNLCLQARAINPRYARAYTWMGAVYEKRGQHVQARQVYQRVLALAPNSPDARHSRRRLKFLETTRDTNVGLASTDGVTSRSSSSQLRLPFVFWSITRRYPGQLYPPFAKAVF
jgi:tetratricopeptide (TPR) repeat protein